MTRATYDSAGEADLCYLTTTGRKSGLAREIEIWFANSDDGRTHYLMSGARYESDWVKNLQKQPHAELRIATRDSKMLSVIARILEHGDEEALGRSRVVGKYVARDQLSKNDDCDDWNQSALVVALDEID